MGFTNTALEGGKMMLWILVAILFFIVSLVLHVPLPLWLAIVILVITILEFILTAFSTIMLSMIRHPAIYEYKHSISKTLFVGGIVISLVFLYFGVTQAQYVISSIYGLFFSKYLDD